MTTTAKNKEKIRFSKAFWVANTVELFERAAYYGVFIVITLYLSRILGFNDIQAATIAGTFSAFLYLLPTFAGALADKIGFRNSMLLAFTLLTIGYGGLALFPTWLESAGLVERPHREWPAIRHYPDYGSDRHRRSFYQKCNLGNGGQRNDRSYPGQRIRHLLRHGQYRCILG